MPAYPGEDSYSFTIEPPPAQVLARLHGGPCDGGAVIMRDYPGEYDTVRIEDDEHGGPDAVYAPLRVQPVDRRYRDLDYIEPPGPIEEIGD